jgi:hypothetical protein
VRSPAAEQQLKSLQLDRQVENRAAPAPSAARPPEEWLQAIRRLLDSGRMEEATRELREFRRAYPQFELPADMRQLVR